MRTTGLILAVSALIFQAVTFTGAYAQDAQMPENRISFGGDEFVSGNSATISTQPQNDAFAIGNSVQITAPVTGDAHAIGNGVTIDADVSGDIYAAGNSVTIRGSVGEDISAAGNSVVVSGANVGGNARLAGNTVTLSAPVDGSVLVGAESFELNAPIAGDLYVTGNNVTFAADAVVAGTVHIRTNADITVPASVASAERVTIEPADVPDLASNAGQIARDSMWGYWPNGLPSFAVILVVFLIGVIWLALFPRRIMISYLVSRGKPFKSLLTGILSLAMFIGLSIVLAMTLVGIPLMPVSLLILVVAWLIGYLSGAYFLATRVLEAFGQRVEKLGFQVLALGLGLIAAWLLGTLPILGWMTQLVLVFLGLGSIGLAALYRYVDAPFHADLRNQIETTPEA